MEKMVEEGIYFDEVTYGMMVDGYCRKGKLDKVFTLLEEMEMKGVLVILIT